MTLSTERLVRSLTKRATFDEWIVRELVTTTTTRELGRSDLLSMKSEHRFVVSVFRDRRASRGEATIVLARNDDDIVELRLDGAARHAVRNTGPQWRLPRPAAPARVRIADQQLIADPKASINDIGGALAGTKGARVTTATIRVIATRERISLSTGFDHDFDATEVAVGGTIELGARGLRSNARFSRRRRRATDLDLESYLATRIAVLRRSAGASQLAAGTFDLVIATAALEPGDRIDSWLSPLAAQASGQLARRGLSRYQPGQRAIARAGGDSITVASDGTINDGLESAPVDEWGGPVRRFRLIDDGVATSLAVTSRDAALLGVDGNGGARNLSLPSGERSVEEMSDGNRPRLVIEDLDTLKVDRHSGDLAAQIGLATSKDVAFTGGHFTLNLFEALSRARLSRAATTNKRGGPEWIAVPAVRIVT